jgi:hypothetical protein
MRWSSRREKNRLHRRLISISMVRTGRRSGPVPNTDQDASEQYPLLQLASFALPRHEREDLGMPSYRS